MPSPAAAVVAPNAEPKSSDYPNTRDGQMEYLRKYHEWRDNQGQQEEPKPGEAQPGAQPSAQPGVQAEAQPGAEDQPKPTEGAQQPQPPADAPAPTPQQLAELMDAKPALKTLFDQDPELKGTIFGMARDLATAQKVTSLIPTESDAQFVLENSQAMVGLKTASMRAIDDPAAVGSALDMFDQQFTRMDDQGKPLLDENGQPRYDADRKIFIDGLVRREDGAVTKQIQGQFDALKQKLTTQAYPNDAAKALDQKRLDDLEYALTAMQVVEQVRSGDFFQAGAPELPTDATPEMKAWFEQEKQKLDAQRAELDKQKQGASREERLAARTKFNTDVRSGYAGNVGRMLGEAIQQKIDSGIYIPQFYLQEKYVDPKTGQESNTAGIVARIFLAFENELNKPGSRSAMTIAEHELLPTNDQTKTMRLNWYQQQAKIIVPKLVKDEMDRIQKLVKLDAAKQAERIQARNQAVQPEPVSGGSSLPQGASDAQIWAQAQEAAKKNTEYQSASPADREAMTMTQYHRLRRPVK